MEQFGYQTINIIGSGTFGTVYKCVDPNNMNCCIKKIKLVKSSTVLANRHIEMIQQEIFLLHNLIHPRIISLLGYFWSNDNREIFIVMEYASFGSLSMMIGHRRAQMSFFEESQIKDMFNDVLLGIEYLHMKNVVHKDLKPCNILVGDDKRLKIADFGVSKIADDNSNNNNNNNNNVVQSKQLKEIGGSPIYMAPETLIYNQFTFASDIWALGCILYELFALHAAFDSVDSMDELIRRTLTKGYIPIESNYHLYSNQLIDLCYSMMNADAKKRITIKEIICNPSIIIDYYHRYFQFDS